MTKQRLPGKLVRIIYIIYILYLTISYGLAKESNIEVYYYAL